MSACVLDTDVVIAALDRADAHHGAASRAFERFVAEETELLLCVVNYAESLDRPAAGRESRCRSLTHEIRRLEPVGDADVVAVKLAQERLDGFVQGCPRCWRIGMRELVANVLDVL